MNVRYHKVTSCTKPGISTAISKCIEHMYLPEDCSMNLKFIIKRLSKDIRMTFRDFLTVFNGNIVLRAIVYKFRQSKMILCYRKQYSKFNTLC